MSYQIDDVLAGLPDHRRLIGSLELMPAPPYTPKDKDQPTKGIGLSVPSMHKHMTDEGWQLFLALKSAGYQLAGYQVSRVVTGPEGTLDTTDVKAIVEYANPAVLVLQDKREWEGRTAGPGFDMQERYTNVEYLEARPDIFKLTVLKDCQFNLPYHRQSANEIGCHAWIVYYHPRIVKHLAPYVRMRHLIRTYHSLDASLVPPYRSDRLKRGLLSGSIAGNAYPLRQRLATGYNANLLPELDYLPHPGWHRHHCDTPGYLVRLSQYRVAVCTTTLYGFALRKMMEATACGCRVITDFQADDPLPGIDENLIRVHPDTPIPEMREVIHSAIEEYDADRQEAYAKLACSYYDYKAAGARLVQDIEAMRRSYRGK